YSVNSVEKPVNGERCKPDMNPSTTARANNSSEPIRASTSGSRNRAGPGDEAAAGEPPARLSVLVFLFHHISKNDPLNYTNDTRNSVSDISCIFVDRSLRLRLKAAL